MGVPWSLSFVLGLPPRDGLKAIQVTMKHDPFVGIRVGTHVGFTSILHSHTSLVPQT